MRPSEASISPARIFSSDLQQRGLPGPVGADDRDAVPALDGERDPVEHHVLTKRLAQAVDAHRRSRATIGCRKREAHFAG
jgi:hypothetical protein